MAAFTPVCQIVGLLIDVAAGIGITADVKTRTLPGRPPEPLLMFIYACLPYCVPSDDSRRRR